MSEKLNTTPCASLNFVDMSRNNGPSVNEVEFNLWLLQREKNALVFTPVATNRLPRDRTIVFGNWTLRNPIRAIAKQISLSRSLARMLDKDALVYYRHSRLVVVPLILKYLRPDIRLAAVRMNGAAASDASIAGQLPRRWILNCIEALDWSIRKYIVHSASWIDCVTSQFATALSSATGRNIEVVGNGVNSFMFRLIPTEERIAMRRALGISDDKVIVGYCGGFPLQRGAREIATLCSQNREVFGIVVGKLSDSTALGNDLTNLMLAGEVDYSDVHSFVGIFDVAVAFDNAERAKNLGNSNQKIRQSLACGAYVLTHYSDIDLESNPVLGRNLANKRAETVAEALNAARPFLKQRSERAEFAKKHLEVEVLFERRHQQIIGLD